MNWQEILSGAFAPSPVQMDAFGRLDALYRDWNARINVISRKDIDALYEHHVLHSLAIARYLQTAPSLWEEFSRASVLDLGTGGGFPGIPLAILFPGAQFTLCDSVGKKTLVAGSVAQALGLGNVRVVNRRAESLGEQFSFVVSRAVASLPEFYPWVKNSYTRGVLYLKGGDVAEEIAQLMGRFRIAGSKVHSWSVSAWLQDPYYEGKRVIHLER